VTVATTVLLESLITETVLPGEFDEPKFPTKSSPFPESYATPKGPVPTVTVATTALVESLITETVLPGKFGAAKFVTKTSPFPESYATL